MIIRSENMRTDSDPLGPNPTLDQAFQVFWDARLSAPEQSEENLAAIAPVVSNSLRNAAQGTLRREGAPSPNHDAEDVAQTWITKMLDRGARQYDPNRGCFRYNFSALRNNCRDVLRDIRRRRSVPLSDSVPANGNSPSALAIERERRAQVRKAVRQLPKAMRRIVKAKYWMGLRSKQIAVLLGFKVKAVDRLAFNARKRLRKELGVLQLSD